ncbi:YbjQ family protein [Arcanobacterium hippocoleae]
MNGETIAGINILKDIGAGFRNIFGGRSQGYEEELVQARDFAMQEMVARAEQMGAHAVIGFRFDYESLGQGNMLMVVATGTAVTLN